MISASNCNVYLVLVGYTAEDINNSVPDRATNYTTQRPGGNQVNVVQVKIYRWKTESGKKKKKKMSENTNDKS